MDKTTAVILVQIGGPESLKEVSGFIRKMLSDKHVIHLPDIIRLPLASFISIIRSKKVKARYNMIGGGSPIINQTRKQAKELEAILGDDFKVFVGMRYSKPSIEDAIQEAMNLKVKGMIFLPLYPQFSYTTSGSAFSEIERCYKKYDIRIPKVLIKDYAEDQGYINAMVECIYEGIKKHHITGDIHYLFTAHSLPESYVRKGDPYPDRVLATMKAVANKMGIDKYALCYQSKLGPLRWVGPSINEMVVSLGEKGVETIVVIPISFVSEHIETLYDLDIEVRRLAISCGIKNFIRIQTVGSSSIFISALKRLVLDYKASI